MLQRSVKSALRKVANNYREGMSLHPPLANGVAQALMTSGEFKRQVKSYRGFSDSNKERFQRLERMLMDYEGQDRITLDGLHRQFEMLYEMEHVVYQYMSGFNQPTYQASRGRVYAYQEYRDLEVLLDSIQQEYYTLMRHVLAEDLPMWSPFPKDGEHKWRHESFQKLWAQLMDKRNGQVVIKERLGDRAENQRLVGFRTRVMANLFRIMSKPWGLYLMQNIMDKKHSPIVVYPGKAYEPHFFPTCKSYKQSDYSRSYPEMNRSKNFSYASIDFTRKDSDAMVKDSKWKRYQKVESSTIGHVPPSRIEDQLKAVEIDESLALTETLRDTGLEMGSIVPHTQVVEAPTLSRRELKDYQWEDIDVAEGSIIRQGAAPMLDRYQTGGYLPNPSFLHLAEVLLMHDVDDLGGQRKIVAPPKDNFLQDSDLKEWDSEFWYKVHQAENSLRREHGLGEMKWHRQFRSSAIGK
ncbi:hypothetical protein [Aureibacter tunicatorum]|uniref:Uncharacterized protein n=1 Tax=Aureibacter tunicatorum TaxID=866807 RepID=A0AAE3XN21_9BACT|nr:hypothetical protein [Aureibacter tunicatorum]MDR6238771.1 hypothetical protein [Aureibacter tunicatorum]BDD05298.1 hypothetical protein AUTU_27810 [Aureibacter tunicatorum]